MSKKISILGKKTTLKDADILTGVDLTLAVNSQNFGITAVSLDARWAPKDPFDTHIADLALHLTTAQNAGLDAADAGPYPPSGANRFLTLEEGNATYQLVGADVGTDLGNVPTLTTVEISSSTGDNTVLAAAGANAGVMTAADKTALDSAVTDQHTHANKGALDKVTDAGAGDAWLANNGQYTVPSGGQEALYVDGSNDMDAPVSFAAGAALDQKRVQFLAPDWWIGLSDIGGRLDVSIGSDLGNHFFRVMSQGTTQRFAVGNSLITANVPITGVHPPTADGHLATKQYVDENAGSGGPTDIADLDDRANVAGKIAETVGDGTVRLIDTPTGGPGGSGDKVEWTVTQANTFSALSDIGMPLYFDGTIWAKADADNVSTLHTALLSEVIDGSSFKIQQSGNLTGLTYKSDLVPGEYYYVQNDGTYGTSPGTFSDIALYSLAADECMVLSFRPLAQNNGSQFPVNTSFPGDTIPSGYQFYRTDIDVQFVWNGTTWVPDASYAALNIYVSSSGTGDPYDAGDGVTTLAAAWAAIPSVLNADVTITVANGTYGDGTTEELGGKTPGGPFFIYITGSAKANVNYGNPLSITGQSNLRFSGITFTRMLTLLDTSNVRYDACDIDTSTDAIAIDSYGGSVGFVFYNGTLRVSNQNNPNAVFMRAADNMKFELSEIISNNCSGTYKAVRADFATLVYCRSTNIRSVGGTATTRKAFELSRTVLHAYQSPDGGSPASEIESSMNYGVEFKSFSSISFNTVANIVNNATANKWVDTANLNSGGA